MKARLAALIAMLRQRGVEVSVAESIDGARAAAAVGVERAVLRDALAAALVKDERDRAVFEEAFAATFPAAPAPAEGASRKRRGRASETDGGAAVHGRGRGAGTGGVSDHQDAKQPSAVTASGRQQAKEPSAAETPARAPAGANGTRPSRAAAPRDRQGVRALSRRSSATAEGAASPDPEVARRRRERALLTLPFHAMEPRDVEDAEELTRALARRLTARLRRRRAPRPRGRLDFRRTIRAAISHGGVPAERRYRGRRRGKPSLVALCDLSASTATATTFFLGLLSPAIEHFRSVRLFGYVDRPIEIEFVAGQVRPAAPIDLMARSDFGRVLVEFMAGPGADLTADTVLLILGDARNNRRPPRADLLAAAHARVRRLLWITPDPLERWNIGDSVIGTYARHADAVVPCGSLAELDRALAVVARL